MITTVMLTNSADGELVIKMINQAQIFSLCHETDPIGCAPACGVSGDEGTPTLSPEPSPAEPGDRPSRASLSVHRFPTH